MTLLLEGSRNKADEGGGRGTLCDGFPWLGSHGRRVARVELERGIIWRKGKRRGGMASQYASAQTVQVASDESRCLMSCPGKRSDEIKLPYAFGWRIWCVRMGEKA